MASSDSDHSDTESADLGIELGFIRVLEKEHSWRLHSKVGGKPAWLDPKNIPTSVDLKCSSCGRIMVFLLQVYAPNNENIDAFHRTIYIFCCKTPSCYEHNSSSPFHILRCQLSQDNEFYNSLPPDYDSPQYYKLCKEFAQVCIVCGFAASKVCSRCHEASYCSKEHQARHWKSHKTTCGKKHFEDGEHYAAPYSDFLFPESEIVMENEESVNELEETPLLGGQQSDTYDSFSPSDLEQFANINLTGKEFSLFRKATARCPDQILRYDRGGTPLWCSGENMLTMEMVPKCRCGATRDFEFQVMPQLLNHLEIQNSIEGPSIDWGVLAVYTCSEDCRSPGQSYQLEYLHKQDFGLLD